MKRVFIYALALSSVFFACSDNDSDEVDNLKKQLEAEQNKTVSDVTFEGDNMVIAFSNGTKTTMTASSVIEGAKGETGNGIATITFNKETGVLAITMTNGTKTEFNIVETLDGRVAVLKEDSNGACYIKTLYLGAVPLIENTYDEDFNLKKSIISTNIDGMILKTNEVEKTYTAGKLTGIKTAEYAMESAVKYTTEYLNDESYVYFNEFKSDYIQDGYAYIYSWSSGNEYFYEKYIAFTVDKGSFYKEPTTTTGVYTLFVYQTSRVIGGTTYYLYNKYSYARQSGVPSSGYYKESDNVVYGMNYESFYTNSGSEYWYIAYRKYTKTGTYQIGDKTSEKSYQIECNDNNQIVKAYSSDTRYIQYTYANSKLSKAEEFENNTSTSQYVTFIYTNGLLTSVKDEDDIEIMKTEYDSNKNPIAIYAYYGATTGEVFDPWSDPNDPWKEAERFEAGLRLLAKIEYYDYKNPLGNTVGAVWSILNDYKINNAIKRVTTVEGMGLASIEYADFNQYGYPETMSGKGTAFGEESLYLEFLLEYAVKEK